MARVWIDGTAHEVDPQRNLLEVCLSLGLDLPYFCWHPTLGSVGACRQCAVKELATEDDRTGRIVMACMTAAADGTRISIDDADARVFRANVIEWLMLNHPHDCPVCDEGGECHLQDMTVMAGHVARRATFPKRTYRSQDLGPFVDHEMNRCIQCYRCVRYYRDYAGGRDLDAFAAHDEVWFGRAEDGPLDSELAGNLVEVCPTGVFTDKTHGRHFVRKWDLSSAPSVCVHCGVGCNTTPGERAGVLRRIRARYHEEVNGHFLCDRGRYGYEVFSGERRLEQALAPAGFDRLAVVLDEAAALRQLAELVAAPARLVGIGSPRASVEANYALRALVGPDRFSAGLATADLRRLRAMLEPLAAGTLRSVSLAEAAACDAVLLLGEDPVRTAPMLGLALRQSVRQEPLRAARALGIPRWHDQALRDAVQDARGPLFVATSLPSALDEIARGSFRAPPAELARLGHAVARALDAGEPEVPELSPATAELARTIAAQLRAAERPLVVSGAGAASEAVVRAAVAVASALARARGGGGPGEIAWAVPECNSFGLALLGGAPLAHVVEVLARGQADAVVVLENDLFRRGPREAVERLLRASRKTVVVDCVASDTGALADLVLPAATFAESEGTLVNHEGRAQRFHRVMTARAPVRESWRWLGEAVRAARGLAEPPWPSIEALRAELAREIPGLTRIREDGPPPGLRLAGAKIPRAFHRQSGRTALRAHLTVIEPAPPPDPETPWAFSMEGYQGRPPGRLAAELWDPGWSSAQALHRFQEEVNGPLTGGPGGVRLFDRPPNGTAAVRAAPPAPFAPREGATLLVPAFFCFGSEELSALSPGIAARAPTPHLLVSSEDLGALGAQDGDVVRVEPEGAAAFALPARSSAGVPRGLAGISVVPGAPSLTLPAWARIVRG